LGSTEFPLPAGERARVRGLETFSGQVHRFL
jgi:hypothetical protein